MNRVRPWVRRTLCVAALVLGAAVTWAVTVPGAGDDARVVFRLPRETAFVLEASADATPPWLTARPEAAPARTVRFGDRVVLQVAPGVELKSLELAATLRPDRAPAPGVWILQAPNAAIAVREAARLAPRPGVVACYPVVQRHLERHGPYAARPADPAFGRQWYLEQRAADGAALGLDLNARAAWPFTRGEGTTVAIVDDGVDLDHPEFSGRSAAGLHHNFATGGADARPAGAGDNHGTAVAGLAVAEQNNRRGMSGVAPGSRVASWKIFAGAGLAVTDEGMMDMFQHRTDAVAVQNHSWGNNDLTPIGPSALESIGISNAVHHGRAGRGVVMVRSAGNGRRQGGNANDDGYASDPRVIAVASVRRDGRAAAYSNPGVCLLVAAPGGDDDGDVFTTDRQGSAAGFNTTSGPDDAADYVESLAVRGTSFAAPQITGLAALLLAANPQLTARDVQLILALAARQFDQADPDLAPNGAGLAFSHQTGFGVPDAGTAVDLARRWRPRPPLTEVSLSATALVPIPDDGWRVEVGGAGVPADLAAIPATPGLGPHADTPTPPVPLVDIGLASAPLGVDLSGKAALIQRGGNVFAEKIQFAAAAGAVFAVVYNNVGTTERLVMGATEYVPIPAVLISQQRGDALRSHLAQHPDAPAQIRVQAARYEFAVTEALACEHVGVWLRTTHPRRGDVRVTLLSPAGTRSVLQAMNQDNLPGPVNWTYYSTRHFLEPSSGTWRLEVSDEQSANAGLVNRVELILRGVAIADADRDGLDDDWEQRAFGSAASGPRDDPDLDGWTNAAEQAQGSDPAVNEAEFRVDVSPWDETHLRLSWPGVAAATYDLLSAPDARLPGARIETVPGRFPVTERIVARPGGSSTLFWIRRDLSGTGRRASGIGGPSSTRP